MAQSALRGLVSGLMQGGPAPSGMASAQTAIQNAAQRPQSSADMLGGLSQFTSLDTPQDMSLGATAADIALGFAPGIGTAQGIRDFERARRDDDMLGMALGGLSAIPLAGGIVKAGRGIGRAAEGALDISQAARLAPDAVEDSFTAYHGTPFVFGPSQRVRDVESGREYVSDPEMASRIMNLKPGQYEVLGENPLGMFDLNRIGTGEGAQAYGIGAYLGGVADTGRDYRTTLLRRSGIEDIPMIGKQPISDFYSSIENKASRLPPNQARNEYDKLEVLEQLMIDGDILSINQRKENFTPEAYAWFEKNVAPKFSRPGALYEVQVNAPQERFLDWDAPVTSQNPEVLQALQKAGIYSPELEQRVALLQNEKELLAKDRDPVTNMMRNERRWHDISKEIEDIRRKQPSNMTGQQAYYMAAPNATSQAEASQALLQRGIPGIRYLDQQSRAAGEGSRNFVIFDPKMIDITKQYGIAGAAVGLSALRQLMPQQEQE
jgi:hypothetical protein